MSDLTMHLPHGRLSLPGNELIRLTRASGIRLQGLAGTLWVTFDNCPQDHVLEAGDSLSIDHRGGVTVSALGGPATLALDEMQPTAAGKLPSVTGWQTLLGLLGWKGLRGWLAPREAACPA